MQPPWACDRYATLEQRARQIDTVYGLVAQTMRERTTAEWLTLFRKLEIPAAPIRTPDGLFDDPHLNAVGLFETVDSPHGRMRFPGVPTWFSHTPGRVAGPAPELGPIPPRCSRKSARADAKAPDTPSKTGFCVCSARKGALSMGVPVYQRILDLFEAEGVNTLFGIPDPNFVHMFLEADRRGWRWWPRITRRARASWPTRPHA
ncbi:acetyl-CoA C-acyltransferase domain protein [Mycobacterium xenopi 4042]|uniref:Acetyl-CoA C-acyltransferase domain protein n=1 Tax=Mycobacterium xenopi 4042 TaxID=1299334 RepID=X8CK27_MYCXE|nr:acetyl-CoA C-acyltransferase domain protein [Mycobacterium xenopi 4042]